MTFAAREIVQDGLYFANRATSTISAVESVSVSQICGPIRLGVGCSQWVLGAFATAIMPGEMHDT